MAIKYRDLQLEVWTKEGEESPVHASFKVCAHGYALQSITMCSALAGETVLHRKQK